MAYELWDVQIGNGLARFDSAHEMVELIGSLIEENGNALAEHLSLIIEETTGEQSALLTGSDLLDWSSEVG